MSLEPTSQNRLFRVHAIHLAERLKLRDIRDRFSKPFKEFSNYEMAIEYSSESYLFVYNYGVAVFFNVPEELQEKELAAIQDLKMWPEQVRVSDAFYLELIEGATNEGGLNPTAPKVYFDRLVARELSYPIIKLSSMLLAESTALEYYELLIETLLERTNLYSKQLESKGQRLESSEDLIKFIGKCLDTKQSIISNLYIVDSPDETWENSVLDKAHQELKIMLEIDTRYRALDYKIRIIQESLEMIVDLLKSKREAFLEMIVIFLISFEILLSIIRH